MVAARKILVITNNKNPLLQW